MDDFTIGNSVKRRDQEIQKRREAMKRQQEQSLLLKSSAVNRTSELIEQIENSRKEQAIREEFERRIDAGAPDNDVRLERILRVSEGSNLNEDSDRVILPQDILEELSKDSRVVYPLMFELYNSVCSKRTHCGVLEFSSDSGTISLPKKVKGCLGVNETDDDVSVRLRYKVLPKCTLVSLKVPLSTFALFPDFKAFLESSLSRQYCTLTVGDIISMGRVFVDQIEPEPAVCIVDADILLDLTIIDDTEGEARWFLGASKHLEERQGRLWLKSIPEGCGIRISSEESDIFVSYPPLMDATESSFDVVDTESIEISYVELLSRQMPEFLTIGSSKAGVLIKTQLVEPSTGVPCPNCERLIPPASLDMHVIRCKALFKYCSDCGKSFRAADLQLHEHCKQCGRSFQKGLEAEHVGVMHAMVSCLCGDSVMRASLETHRSTNCRVKLVLCRFCGCFAPKGDVSKMDARDRFMGFVSEHEAACGNRTEPCLTCGKRERLKDMDFHQKAFHS